MTGAGISSLTHLASAATVYRDLRLLSAKVIQKERRRPLSYYLPPDVTTAPPRTRRISPQYTLNSNRTPSYPLSCPRVRSYRHLCWSYWVMRVLPPGLGSRVEWSASCSEQLRLLSSHGSTCSSMLYRLIPIPPPPSQAFIPPCIRVKTFHL